MNKTITILKGHPTLRKVIQFYKRNQQEAYTLPLDGLLAHHRVNPRPPAFCLISLESMYTPGWREAL